MDVEVLRSLVAEGKVVIPCNKVHTSISPEGIGIRLRTKVNVNLGTSKDVTNYDSEIETVNRANRYQNVIDYIGVGPVFATQTKPNAHPVGISYVYLAKQYSKLPIVAIGGIKISNVESIWKVHLDFICAVSELTEAQDLQNTVYELISGYSKVR